MRNLQWIRAASLVAANALAAAALGGMAMSDEEMAHMHDGATPFAMATVNYEVPDVTLVRQDGKSVSLPAEMDDGRPVVLTFVYTTCTSICPLMSQVLGQFQRKLGADRRKVHLMSISTDPEEDTPARLRDYAQRFHAGPEWQHYTGTVAASQVAQRAFDVYRGDKMSHTAVTLMRARPGQPWMRLDGFLTPDQLMVHYRQLLAAR